MWQTLGYPRIVGALDQAIRGGRPTHAYLIVGSPHVGKRRLAIDLAKAINCTGAPVPCDVCRSCDRIERGVHVDVEWIGLLEEGGRRKRDVTLGQIQTLQHQASLAPFEGRFRVFVIDPADRLNDEAANCLLKTLEEPPAQVVLILLAGSDGTILPTVRSRCQRIDLRPLPAETIAGTLEHRTGLGPRQITRIARRARGRLGWAISAAEDPDLDAARQAIIDEAAGLIYLGSTDRLALVGRLAGEFQKDRHVAADRLATWLEWWRDVLLVALGCPDLVVNADRTAELDRQAAELGPDQIRRVIEATETAIQQLHDNANPRLAIDVLLLQIPVSRHPGPAIGDAGDRDQEMGHHG